MRDAARIPSGHVPLQTNMSKIIRDRVSVMIGVQGSGSAGGGIRLQSPDSRELVAHVGDALRYKGPGGAPPTRNNPVLRSCPPYSPPHPQGSLLGK